MKHRSKNVGARNANAKLSHDDVRLIRALIRERNRLMEEANKLTRQKIAEKFGIKPVTVSKISQHYTWANVK